MKTNCMLAATLLIAATSALPLHAAEGVASPTTRNGAAADNDMTREQLQAKARTMRQDLTNAHFLGADTQEIEKRIMALSQRLEQMGLELDEKKVRLRAVAQKIDELSDRAEKTADADPVVRELRTIVEARTSDAEHIAQMIQSGHSTPDQQRAGAAAVAEARVNVEQRKEAVMAAVGGGILPELNKQMVELSLDVEVLEKMSQVVTMHVDELDQLEDKAIELLHIANVLTAKFKAGIDE